MAFPNQIVDRNVPRRRSVAFFLPGGEKAAFFLPGGEKAAALHVGGVFSKRPRAVV